MAFQAVPETAECFVGYTLQDIPIGNTFYFRKTGGYSFTDLTDLAADMDAWVTAEIKPLLSNQVTYTGCTVRGLANEEDYEVNDSSGAGAGALSGTQLPSNVSFAVQRLSGLTGRSARGRIYWPAFIASQLSSNENVVGATTLVNILEALLEIATYAVTHGWVEVIVSRWHAGMKRATAQTQDVIDWNYSDSRVDTQKRRLS